MLLIPRNIIVLTMIMWGVVGVHKYLRGLSAVANCNYPWFWCFVTFLRAVQSGDRSSMTHQKYLEWCWTMLLIPRNIIFNYDHVRFKVWLAFIHIAGVSTVVPTANTCGSGALLRFLEEPRVAIDCSWHIRSTFNDIELRFSPVWDVLCPTHETLKQLEKTLGTC